MGTKYTTVYPHHPPTPASGTRNRSYKVHNLGRNFSLVAMEAAERNVEERRTALQRASHVQRQEVVTAELLDVQAAYLASGRG